MRVDRKEELNIHTRSRIPCQKNDNKKKPLHFFGSLPLETIAKTDCLRPRIARKQTEKDISDGTSAHKTKRKKATTRKDRY